MTLTPVFLALQAPIGGTIHVQLPRADPFATTWLPNCCDTGIDLSNRCNARHSVVRIQTYSNYLLLSIWDNQHGEISIITASGECINLPVSTETDTKSCILLDGSQFCSLSGRWTVEFDYDYSVSNSMRPPPLPSTTPVRHGPHTEDSEPEVDADKEPVGYAREDDSGFFEDVQQRTTVLTVKTSIHTGHSIFEPESRGSEALQDENVNGFAQHRTTGRDVEEKRTKDEEARKVALQAETHQSELRSDELEHDEDTESSSSVHHEESAERLALNIDTTPGDSPDTTAMSADVADAVTDQEEPSSTANDMFFRRNAGDESQPIPDASDASPSRRALGQKSQAISSDDDLRHSSHLFGQASRTTMARYAPNPEQIEVGLKSPATVIEDVLKQYRRQIAPESQEVPPSVSIKSERRRSIVVGRILSPEKAPELSKRGPGEGSQVLRQPDTGIPAQIMLSAPGMSAESSTLVPTQSLTTSAFHTPRKPGSCTSPTTPQMPRALQVRSSLKRKRSESTNTETSGFDSQPLRVHLTARLRSHSESASGMSATSSYYNVPASLSTISNGEADADTITVNTVRNTQKSEKTQITRSSKRRGRQVSTVPGGVELPLNPKVIFSGRCAIRNKKHVMDAFDYLGGIVVDKVANADMVCIPDGELRKSPKLILALIYGKHIVTERWITECHRQKHFPDPAQYLPFDPEQERKWKFNLTAAVQRCRDADSKIRQLIVDYKVYVTPQLYRKKLSGIWDDFKAIADSIGAKSVHARLPADVARNSKTLVLGDENDVDALKVGKLGCCLYKNDLLTMAVLRGELEVDSGEFELEIPIKEESESQN